MNVNKMNWTNEQTERKENSTPNQKPPSQTLKTKLIRKNNGTNVHLKE